ncbi:pyridoxamine 5'-phosphate oxidase family protein [Streptomyces sp. BK79]|uniref:pyridoxamine 5'-phosphate oxidase family protein n=1 Tax=Streptomyces sp. BK79 TaxID=3350097 RepID=UPI00377053BC
MPSDAQLAVGLLGRASHGRAATSLRALPFLAFARHIVADGRVLLRMPRSFGYHEVCAGSVVAYGADNLGRAGLGEGLWVVQVVGRCEVHEPSAAEIERFGPAPREVDGVPFEPVYLRIEPRFGSVHVTDGAVAAVSG